MHLPHKSGMLAESKLTQVKQITIFQFKQMWNL